MKPEATIAALALAQLATCVTSTRARYDIYLPNLRQLAVGVCFFDHQLRISQVRNHIAPSSAAAAQHRKNTSSHLYFPKEKQWRLCL